MSATATDRERAPDAGGAAGIADGSAAAFEELYEVYSHELYDFAARITRDRAAAADVVQDVFAKLWERSQRGDEVRAPRAWLYRATHNAAIDEIRRRRWTTPGGGDQTIDFAAVEDTTTQEPGRGLLDKELAELVWSTAAALKPDDYALLDLHVRRELTPDELAEELGITRGAVDTRLSRLRRSFEEALTVKLLTRRGTKDCEELGYLVSTLGERAETDEGWRLLRAHIRDCSTCQEVRRRYVTAAELLGALAPVPLLPGLQGAIWSSLAALPSPGGGAANGGTPVRTQEGGSPQAGAGMRPLAVGAVVLAILAALAAGGWAARVALLSDSSTAAARDPSGVWSPSHEAGGRSSDNRVTISWSPQPDAVAFSVLWSHVPREEPDDVPDLAGSATSVTSPALAPGRWYFHLRTQGRDDSWTHTVHLGPFVVLAAAPSGPGSSRTEPPAGGRGGGAGVEPGGAEPGSAAGSSPGLTAGTGAVAGTGKGAATDADATPPSGQGVELAGGRYYRALAVPLVLRRGSDDASGVDPATGVVERQAAVLKNDVCGGWSAWTVVAVPATTDPGVADGRCYRYRYRISDRAGNRSAFSAPSRTAAVDVTPPARPTLSLVEDGPDTVVAATTLFYRPAGGGGAFSATAASDDGGSGLAAIEFPGLAAGMTPAARTRRTAAPYHVTYTWRTGAAESGTKTVIAYDRAGNASRARFAIAADETAPGGASVAVTGGPWFTAASVPLVLERGADDESGLASGSTRVERDSAALAAGRCEPFAGAWAGVSLVGAADTTVESGRCYRYRVSAVDNVGNRYISPPSGEARIDTTPPSAPRLTLHASSSSVHVTGIELFYRPAAEGSFTVEAATQDPESGIARVSFPELGEATGGADDERDPYETSYRWSSAFNAAGAHAVSASNRAGASARSDFTVTQDGAGPTAMVAEVVGGPWFAGPVTLAIGTGTDAGSGVDRASVRVERDSARLVAGTCGAFTGAWTTVSPAGGADTAVESGNCYRYRVSTSDNVGNRSTSPPSGDARVDTTPPSPPALTLTSSSSTVHVSGTTVFYRPTVSGSLAIAATSADPETGIARISFPALAGASGGDGDEAAPYETTFSWLALIAAGEESVIASNPAGLASRSAFSLAADADGPIGTSVTLVGGPRFSGGSVTLKIEEGADAGSGVRPGSVTVERDSASLVSGTCDSFTGAWVAVPLGGSADTSVERGNCYRYRVTVSDNVGNLSTSPPTDAATVDLPASAAP